MTDIYDQAQAIEQLQRDAALAAQAAASRALGPSLEHCDDCGDEIPPARRLAAPGCTRCVQCQNKREKRRP